MQLSMDEITCGYPNAKRRLVEQMTVSLAEHHIYAAQGAYCLMCVLFQNDVRLDGIDAFVSYSPAGYLLAKELARLERKEHLHLVFPYDRPKEPCDKTKKVVLVAGLTLRGSGHEPVVINRLHKMGLEISAVATLIDSRDDAGAALAGLGERPVCSVFTLGEFLGRNTSPADRKIVMSA